MEAMAKTINGSNRPIDPGEIRVEGVNPPATSAKMLETIPIGKPTEPLISRDGIAVITVCTREQKNLEGDDHRQGKSRIRLVNERIEMLSRQTMRDLHRKAANRHA